MKKLISALTVLTLMMSVSVTVVKATEIDQESSEQSGKTNVSTKVDPTYIVTIPENCNITQGAETTLMSLSVQGNPQPDATIEVDVTKTELVNKSNENYKIPYALTSQQSLFSKISYSEAEIRNGTTTDLLIEITKDTWEQAYAGDYQATLDFTIEYTGGK